MKTRSQHIPIFLSSTYEDLVPYREAVSGVITRLQNIVRGMEFFGSRPGGPKDECLKVLDDCAVYIIIVGMRYGSVDSETGKSMVQLEYERAQDLSIPTLAYIIDEEKQPVLPKHIDTGQNAEVLTSFKSLLKKKHLVSFFTSPENLSLKISQDLADVLSQIGVAGVERLRQSAVEGKDVPKIFKIFQMRPKKVLDQEVIVTIELNEKMQFFSVTPSDAKVNNVPFGDAFRFLSSCYSDDVLLGEFHVYAYGECGDWIESNLGRIEKFNASVRLSWGIRRSYYRLADSGHAVPVDESIQTIVVTDVIES